MPKQVDDPKLQSMSERVRYMEEQEALYEQAKLSFLQEFQGEFIAFEQGQVLDHDPNEAALVERVAQTYGYRDILIKQVLWQEPQFSVGGVYQTQDSE